MQVVCRTLFETYGLPVLLYCVLLLLLLQAIAQPGDFVVFKLVSPGSNGGFG